MYFNYWVDCILMDELIYKLKKALSQILGAKATFKEDLLLLVEKIKDDFLNQHTEYIRISPWLTAYCTIDILYASEESDVLVYQMRAISLKSLIPED